jgi:hypothetical protein
MLLEDVPVLIASTIRRVAREEGAIERVAPELPPRIECLTTVAAIAATDGFSVGTQFSVVKLGFASTLSFVDVESDLMQRHPSDGSRRIHDQLWRNVIGVERSSRATALRTYSRS